MTVTLRPYQQTLIDESRAAYARKVRAVLMQLPTGGGKSYTAASIVHGAAQKGNVTWWIVHRRELCKQASQTFHNLGIPHGIIQAGHVSNPNALVQIASIQTIGRRASSLPKPGLIIFDESHHIGAASWAALFDQFPSAKILGLTATPYRLDGTGLGHWFEEMVQGPTVAELIEMGSLSRYRMFAPSQPDLSQVPTLAGDYQSGAVAKAMDKPHLVACAVDQYGKLCAGKRAIAFNAGIQNSINFVALARAQGIPAEHVDGTTPTDQRDAAVERLRCGQTLILSNDSLFGEGFDIPAVEAVIDRSPSKSLSKVLQNWGRALRPMPGKVATILDHAGNSLIHGLPDDDREWSLEDREKRSKAKPAEVAMKTCKACFYCFRPAPACPACGHVAPVVVREIEQVEGSLEEVKRTDTRAKFKEQGKAQSLDDLIRLGAQRGYKNPSFWAQKVWASRSGRRAA